MRLAAVWTCDLLIRQLDLSRRAELIWCYHHTLSKPWMRMRTAQLEISVALSSGWRDEDILPAFEVVNDELGTYLRPYPMSTKNSFPTSMAIHKGSRSWWLSMAFMTFKCWLGGIKHRSTPVLCSFCFWTDIY
jgi:hypothetical protein